ncbi:MAG: hypothetical protein WCS37_19880 [Chloroflexota bacterium]
MPFKGLLVAPPLIRNCANCILRAGLLERAFTQSSFEEKLPVAKSSTVGLMPPVVVGLLPLALVLRAVVGSLAGLLGLLKTFSKLPGG